MDFVRRRFSQGGSSDDESKSVSSSFSEGTSRFFNSVVAKKNGLLNNISSKIESVGTLMKTNSSSYDESSSEDNSPTKSGPEPKLQDWDVSKDRLYASKGTEYVDRRSNYSSGYSDSSWNGDEPPTSTNVNISFDEPLYSPTSKTFSNKDQFTIQNKVSSGEKGETRIIGDAKQYSAHKNNHGTNHKIVADIHTEHSKDTHANKMKHSSMNDVSSASSNNINKSEIEDNEKTNDVKRAPKFTTTKRRSSTVDEMLFDDYVPPDDFADESPVQSNVNNFGKNKTLIQMGDLMSFDDIEKDVKLPSFPSAGSVESSDYGGYSQTSVDSSDNEFGGVQLYRTASMGSENSWSSSYSIDSQPDDLTLECMEFMKQFIEKIFKSSDISQEEKAKFGELCQFPPGRLWFARYVNSQRVNNKNVTEQIFFRLVQYFATVLFECNEAEDFSPAKTLMNMCFTFYHENLSLAVISKPKYEAEQASRLCRCHGNVKYKNFLYSYLREQPIWQSLRFWNAAFFDAVQCERSRRPVCTSNDAIDTQTDDTQFQENIVFGQLGTFSCNMRAFGLQKELCLEFLRKQSTIANLKGEQLQMLRDNVEKWRDH